MRRRLMCIFVVLAALGAAPVNASAADEYTFEFKLQCRAPGSFEGHVTLYGNAADGSLDYTNVLGSWTCSDTNRTINDELTVEVSDWSESGGFGLLEFRSTAFAYPFGGCDWGFGPQSLEFPGHPGGGGAQFYCSPASPSDPEKNNWMQVLLFSAGDQPDYFGRPL